LEISGRGYAAYAKSTFGAYNWPKVLAEVYMSPKNEYFCTTPKNGSAQEYGNKGGPHGNISARIKMKAFFLHGEIRIV